LDFTVGAGFSPSLILFPPSALQDFPNSIPHFTKERKVKTRNLKIEGFGIQ
jgi:hypothetical protein